MQIPLKNGSVIADSPRSFEFLVKLLKLDYIKIISSFSPTSSSGSSGRRVNVLHLHDPDCRAEIRDLSQEQTHRLG